MNRRHHLAALGALALCARGVLAEPKRALRQMQIHKVRELGLEIWVENQPPWDTTLSTHTGRPTFVAQSPDAYHPPTVMTYMSGPVPIVLTARCPPWPPRRSVAPARISG